MGSLSNNIKSALLSVCAAEKSPGSQRKTTLFLSHCQTLYSKLPRPGGPFEIFKGEVRAAWIFTAAGRRTRGFTTPLPQMLYYRVDTFLTLWCRVRRCFATPRAYFPFHREWIFWPKHTRICALLSIGLRQNKRAASRTTHAGFFNIYVPAENFVIFLSF